MNGNEITMKRIDLIDKVDFRSTPRSNSSHQCRQPHQRPQTSSHGKLIKFKHRPLSQRAPRQMFTLNREIHSSCDSFKTRSKLSPNP